MTRIARVLVNARPSVALRPPPCWQELLDVEAESLERGREAEEHSGERGHDEGESERPLVEETAPPTRGRIPGLEPKKRLMGHDGDDEAQGAAGRGEEQALGQEQADDPAAGGSDRRPERHLPPPSRAPREEHVGDVHAGDEEDHRHRGEGDQKRGTGAAHDLLAQGDEDERPSARRCP